MRTRDVLRIALPAVLLVSACASEEAPVRQPPPVTVARPEIRTIQNYAVFTGSSRAIESTDIVARVAGELQTIEFEPGRVVEKGQPLFRIEPDAYIAERDAAAASVKSAEAELLRAETELNRVQRASENNAVSELDLDTAKASRDKADAALMSAQASLAEAELQLSYTVVRSPIDGVAGRNLVDAGNLVGQSGPTVLTTVNKIQPIFVYFNPPESLVLAYLAYLRELEDKDPGSVQAGQSKRDNTGAYVELSNETGFPHEADVDFVDNTVDPNTGTIEMRVRVENERGFLFPGLFVRVKIMGRLIPDAVLVPEVAVGSDLGGKFIYVVGENNIVERRYVALGQLEDDGTIHVMNGLEGDETIIVNGILFARPGLPVTPLTAEQFEQMQRQQAQG
jgi:RND family efflux transporter MFP subunit